MSGSDVYNSLVTENEIDPDSYGLTVLPLDGADAGVLAGGTIASVVADAEALVANDAPVGTPALPIFSREQLAQSDAWVADLVNVPQAQMAGFRDNIFDQPLVPEPPSHAQEMYALLDTVVQTVLTDKDADGKRHYYWNDPWHFALSRMMVACRAYGLRPIDGPFGDFSDPDGYTAAAKRAAVLGFEGKWAIHPSQVELANKVFTPSDAEVTKAKRIVEAMQQAAREGKGAVSLDGRLIDIASIRQAEALLNKARAMGMA